MIRLRVMKQWFDWVDAERRSPIAEQLVTPWFAPEAQAVVRCRPASSNIVYRVRVGGQTLYLRCNHESERTTAAYAAEMAFVQHLAAAGVRVARPVPLRTGAPVAQVPTPLGILQAVLLEEAVGVERELLAMDEPSLTLWGRTLAGLNAAAEGSVGRGRPGWREHLGFARLHRSVAEGRGPDEPPWITDLRATLVRTMNGFRDGFARYPVQQYLP